MEQTGSSNLPVSIHRGLNEEPYSKKLLQCEVNNTKARPDGDWKLLHTSLRLSACCR
jgi:hypothetical protein